ncbi:TonB protein [Salinisphaera shabanensis E1L3A]|uniref:TonB protein n=1 Tax=Salinisphaera shabanensis E1L3A TaxID=1033802 RepID=U2ES44_9GAMM|nr:TonB family protein [Salinisphaera shabanensis]ERJ20812.1 TonB protein [Salinisphaera shabanensis E1L3A]
MSSVRARFCFCLAIALILHAALLGWSNESSQSEDGRLLAATRTVADAAEAAPETAIRATRNQQGDDRSSQHALAASPPVEPRPDARLQPDGARTITRFVMVAEPVIEQRDEAPDTPSPPVEVIREPQPAQISAAAQDARAEYLAAWQERIETRGSRRYPRALLDAEHPRRLTMAVRVRAGGTLLAVRVLRSSGNDALDNAALAIVRGAAPYPPFDEPLIALTDELSFAYDWLFEPGGSGQISRND